MGTECVTAGAERHTSVRFGQTNKQKNRPEARTDARDRTREQTKDNTRAGGDESTDGRTRVKSGQTSSPSVRPPPLSPELIFLVKPPADATPLAFSLALPRCSSKSPRSGTLARSAPPLCAHLAFLPPETPRASPLSRSGGRDRFSAHDPRVCVQSSLEHSPPDHSVVLEPLTAEGHPAQPHAPPVRCSSPLVMQHLGPPRHGRGAPSLPWCRAVLAA